MGEFCDQDLMRHMHGSLAITQLVHEKEHLVVGCFVRAQLNYALHLTERLSKCYLDKGCTSICVLLFFPFQIQYQRLTISEITQLP